MTSVRSTLVAVTSVGLCVWATLGVVREASGEQALRATERASAVGSPMTRGRVSIVASTQPRRVFQENAKTGRISILAGSLDFLLRIAYGAHPRDIVYELPVDLDARYDVVAMPPDRKRDTAIQMLREELETSFGFTASLEDRLVDAHIMRRLEGALPLEESTSQAKQVVGSHNRFAGKRASMNDLARFTRTLTPGPVVDETGFDAVYDIVLEWDSAAGNHALRQAFEDLGLELIDEERSVEQLVIRPIPKPVNPTSGHSPASSKAAPDG